MRKTLPEGAPNLELGAALQQVHTEAKDKKSGADAAKAAELDQAAKTLADENKAPVLRERYLTATGSEAPNFGKDYRKIDLARDIIVAERAKAPVKKQRTKKPQQQRQQRKDSRAPKGQASTAEEAALQAAEAKVTYLEHQVGDLKATVNDLQTALDDLPRAFHVLADRVEIIENRPVDSEFVDSLGRTMDEKVAASAEVLNGRIDVANAGVATATATAQASLNKATNAEEQARSANALASRHEEELAGLRPTPMGFGDWLINGLRASARQAADA
jgi:hypothetical protein